MAKRVETQLVSILFGILMISAGIVLPGIAQAQFADGAEYADAKGLMARKKWDEAVIALRKLQRSEPDSLELTIDLSKALTYSGRREEALSLLSHSANRLRGSSKGSLTRRGKVLSRIFLTQTTQQLYQDGVAQAIGKKYRGARERFEKALEQEPDNVEILIRMGQCLLLEGDADSAAERLKLARKLNPYEPEIRLWLGKALRDRGELPVAIEELRLAQTQLADSELAPAWYAEALAQSGQKASAVSLLERDIREHPFHLLGLVTLARLRLQTGAFDKIESRTLWDVRKNLQVAMSRIDQYQGPESPMSEGELGLDLRDSKTLKAEVESLLERVESRIDGTSSK